MMVLFKDEQIFCSNFSLSLTKNTYRHLSQEKGELTIAPWSTKLFIDTAVAVFSYLSHECSYSGFSSLNNLIQPYPPQWSLTVV